MNPIKNTIRRGPSHVVDGTSKNRKGNRNVAMITIITIRINSSGSS